MLKGLGSVLPSPNPSAPCVEDSIWSAWTAGAAETRAFATARAALVALLRVRGVRRLWLPAYCCDSLVEGMAAADVDVFWYGVTARLEAVTADLETGALTAGDAVLAIAYFGRSPDDQLRALAARRPDVLWIEDRAQALDTGVPSLGAVTLYSPRKLLGVGDGGLLVGSSLPAPSDLAMSEAELWKPNDLRHADPDGLAPEAWFTAFRARETAFDTTPRPCSVRTLSALRAAPLKAEAEARRRNWRALASRLRAVALWPDVEPTFAPLAFPIISNASATLVAGLAEHRIWAARHWVDLPSPQTFRTAHSLSQTCLSLPLDGRYDTEDMHRIADVVVALAGL